MKLYYTPKSHFARKVRIVMDALDIDCELIDAGNVADQAVPLFGDNPLMKVPTLEDGSNWLIDSDHIAAYLVRKHDPDDRFRVATTDINELNCRAVMNGVMTAEVDVLLARRTGINTEGYARFTKIQGSISTGLTWLETHAECVPIAPSYLGFHLVCLWDHLAASGLVTLNHPRLAEHTKRLSALPYVSRSAPPA